VHRGERSAVGVIPGADTMSGAGADTLMCMRGPHRAWDTWGEGREGAMWARMAVCPGATVPGLRGSARSSGLQRLRALAGLLPEPRMPVWVIVSTSLLCSDACHPTLHSCRRQLIRQGFPFWKLGATPKVTRVSNSAEGILPYPSVLS